MMSSSPCWFSGSSGCCSLLFWMFVVCSTMALVQFVYSAVPGLAWYSSSKYVAMWSFVYWGSVRILLSSVMVL